MRSYFFVPATKLNKIPAIQSLGISEIVVDFEDAVLLTQIEFLLEKVKCTANYKSFWYRIPLRNDYKDHINLDFLVKICNFGINKLILPKLISEKELEFVFEKLSVFKNMKLILLIEHPRLLYEMVQVLQVPKFDGVIIGLGLGSHDLMTFMHMEHTHEQLKYPRTQLIFLAKAYGKEAIDMAEMNISSKEKFEKELLFGIENGFDAKFLIHPIQIEWFQQYEGNRAKQISWAKKIIAALPEGHMGKEVEPFILDGEVVEKPHVEKARLILKKFED